MIDKIVLSNCRTRACILFTNKHAFEICSDTNVIPLLMWFLDCPRAHLVIDDFTITGVELRRDTADEVTVKIFLKDVA